MAKWAEFCPGLWPYCTSLCCRAQHSRVEWHTFFVLRMTFVSVIRLTQEVLLCRPAIIPLVFPRHVPLHRIVVVAFRGLLFGLVVLGFGKVARLDRCGSCCRRFCCRVTCHANWYFVVLWCVVDASCCGVLCCAVLCCAVLCCADLCCTMLCCTVCACACFLHMHLFVLLRQFFILSYTCMYMYVHMSFHIKYV